MALPFPEPIEQMPQPWALQQKNMQHLSLNRSSQIPDLKFLKPKHGNALSKTHEQIPQTWALQEKWVHTLSLRQPSPNQFL